jgi:hypothetical protein
VVPKVLQVQVVLAVQQRPESERPLHQAAQEVRQFPEHSVVAVVQQAPAEQAQQVVQATQ